MKSFIEKIRLAHKKSQGFNLPIEWYLKRSSIGNIEPSDRVIKKYSPYIDLTGEDERSRIEYFDYASELNISLPEPLKINAEKVNRMRVEAKRKTLSITCPYKALSQIVAKNDLRLSMTGVHHKNGYIEATDGHVLVKTRKGYSPELEGVVTTPDILMDKIEENYPDTEKALLYNSTHDSYDKVPCDLSILLGKIHQMSFLSRNMYNTTRSAVSIFDQGNFDLLLIKKVVSCIIQLGSDLAVVSISKREKGPLIITSLDGHTVALAMGITREDPKDHPEFMIGKEEIIIKIK